MHRDAVGAERVDDPRVVGAVGRIANGQPCIAQPDVRVIAAVREEVEITRIARDTLLGCDVNRPASSS
jgi:hypothetical protein